MQNEAAVRRTYSTRLSRVEHVDHRSLRIKHPSTAATATANWINRSRFLLLQSTIWFGYGGSRRLKIHFPIHAESARATTEGLLLAYFPQLFLSRKDSTFSVATETGSVGNKDSIAFLTNYQSLRNFATSLKPISSMNTTRNCWYGFPFPFTR